MDRFLRLHQELHARPLPDVGVGSTVFHLAIFRGEVTIQEEKQHLDDLARMLAASIHSAGDSHLQVRIGGSCLRLEFHTEFTEYTFITNSLTDFDSESTIDIISNDWIEQIPGETINRLRICVEQVDDYRQEAPHSSGNLGTESRENAARPLRFTGDRCWSIITRGELRLSRCRSRSVNHAMKGSARSGSLADNPYTWHSGHQDHDGW